MPRTRRDRRLRTGLLLAAATIAIACLMRRAPVAAQTPDSAQSSVALRLTAERAEAFLKAYDRKLHYLPGEVLVKFKPGVSLDGEQRALMAIRSRPDVTGLQWSGDVAVLRDASQPDATILAAQLSSQPEVEYAEPNYIVPIPRSDTRFSAEPTPVGSRPLGTPNDPDYGSRQWNFADIGMPKAWDIQPGGQSSLIVAVVDTGVTTSKQSMTFPIFNGTAIQNFTMPFDVSSDLDASRLVSPFDFAFLAAGGPVFDMDGHGTHVASTIAESTNNNFALAGIAYQVKIMPVKVCTGYWEIMIARAESGMTGFAPIDAGGCADSDIASGIRYAVDRGARVINISLGGPGRSQTIFDALNYAVQHGAFIAVAGGNGYESGNEVEYPAGYGPDIEGMMTVAATGRSRNRAYYSSTGKQIEIAAPGGDENDGGSSGVIWQVTLRVGDSKPLVVTLPRFDRYAEVGYTGTSMASPHVAGTAALIMSQIGPSATPALVEQIIRATALHLGSPGKNPEFGYGLVQPRTALFGHGIKK